MHWRRTVALTLALLAGMALANPPGAWATIGVVSKTLASVTPTGAVPNSAAARPVISADGRYVAFISMATDLGPAVSASSANLGQTYVHDRQTGATELISMGTDGQAGDKGAYPRGMSADGRYVLFTTASTNMPQYGVHPPTNLELLYVRDRHTGTTTVLGDPATTLGSSSTTHAMSADGHLIAYTASVQTANGTTNENRVFNRATNTTVTLPADKQAVTLSPDGRYAGFIDLAPHLTPEGYNAFNAYRYDLASAAAQLVTDRTAGEGIDLNFDGSDFLYYAQSTTDPRNSDVVYTDIASGNSRTLFTGSEDAAEQGLAIDRHSRRVAFFVFTETPTRGGKAIMADLADGDETEVDNGLFIRPDVKMTDDGTALTYSSVNVPPGSTNQVFVAQLTPPDTTPPIVTGRPDRQPNPHGWYNSGVTITWTATNDSGTATQPAPTSATTEGSDVAYTSDPSCDPSGNCATGHLTLSIDTTAPTISSVVGPTPNSQGWNNTDVTVAFTCGDTLSGIDTCSSPVTMSTQTAGQTINGAATDRAGNAAATNTTVKIDKTAPVVGNLTLSPSTVLFSGTLTISAQVADALSGVSRAEYYIDTDPGQGNATAMSYNSSTATASAATSITSGSLRVGRHTVYVRSRDTAGNWSTSSSKAFTYV